MNNTMDIKYIWNETSLRVMPKVTQITYDVWIKPLTPMTISGDKLILLAPLETCKKIVLTQYKSLIDPILKELCPFVNGIEVVCESDANITEFDSEDKINKAVINDNSINSQNAVNSLFDELYIFDNFVVGDSNQAAYTAARAVAENPGKAINPLYIYGGVGLGKTHIIHSIGNYIRRNFPNKRIIYVTTATFTNEYIDSIAKVKDNDLNKQFREKYRNVDVLMLDDIQFINGKLATQEALFHIFNDLYQTGRQIIFTSDCHPKNLNNMEERLKSRFQSGITVDISSPSLETRIAILQRKAFQKKYQISTEVINYIAEKIDSNIRELEGALSKVMFHCALHGVSADNIEIVNIALKDEIDNKSGLLTIDSIVDSVCDYFNVDKLDLKGKKKTKQLTEPRQIAIYLISDLLSVPLVTIGDYFGGRDHSTMIHARDKISSLIETNTCYKSYIKDLTDIIKMKN